MWDQIKDWLVAGGGIPNDRDLKEHLCGPEFGFDNKDRLQLERKIDLKERLGYSPDCGDALAYSFAEPVSASHVHHKGRKKKQFAKTEYDVLSYGQ